MLQGTGYMLQVTGYMLQGTWFRLAQVQTQVAFPKT